MAVAAASVACAEHVVMCRTACEAEAVVAVDDTCCCGCGTREEVLVRRWRTRAA